jgi:outer membrane protein, multidrug efflux system
MFSKKTQFVSISFLSIFLTGCSFHTKPFTEEERQKKALSDREKIREHTPRPTKPITFYEALARGIKYNLDHRVKALEEAYALNLSNIADWDMLPPITTSAGYSRRSNVLASNSQSIATGQQSLETSTSTDNNRRLFDIGVLWNVLDFGTAYFTSRQKSDEAKIAQLRRQKVLQNMAFDIRNAYWRAVTAELLLKEVDQVIDLGYGALKNARNLEKERIQPLPISLNYQKIILDAISKLFKQRRELAMAKAELASLMNLEPGTPFEVETIHKKKLNLPEINVSVDALENIALVHRPEVWEEDYNQRISKNEIYKLYTSFFPGINLEARRNYDSNSFLYNQPWTDFSAKLGLSLFKMLATPSRIRAERQKGSVISTRRLALSMAILTQIHLSLERYSIAKKEYVFSKQIDRVNTKIASISKSKVQAELEDNLKLIEDKASEIVGRVRRYASYTEVQNAYGRLINSLGVNPFPMIITEDLDEMTRLIESHLSKTELKLDNQSLLSFTLNAKTAS